jgi:phosphoribosyl-AMP cyclohydrolase
MWWRVFDELQEFEEMQWKEIIDKQIKEKGIWYIKELQERWLSQQTWRVADYLKKYLNEKIKSSEQEVDNLINQWKTAEQIDEKLWKGSFEYFKWPVYETYNPTEQEREEIEDEVEEQNNPYYKRLKKELWEDFETSKDKLKQLKEYAKTDYIKDLQKNNSTFAQTMNRATNFLSKRWLLNSWIAKAKANIWTTELNKQISNRTEYFDRKMEDLWQSGQDLSKRYKRTLAKINKEQDFQNKMDVEKSIKQKSAENRRDYELKYKAYATWPRKPRTF